MSLEAVFNRLKEKKVLSTALILLTLAVGILLGTLISTGVNAARQQAAAPDARPLVIPSPVQASNTFAEIAKRLMPAVVNINSEGTVKAPTANRRRRQTRPTEEEPSEDPREDLFRRFFGGRGFDFGPFEAPEGDQKVRNLGSGFIVDPNGYIITNHHVIEKADRIRVKLMDDATPYVAKLIGSDPETDLAVIKIDVKKPLTYARVGNSDAVQVGDWAMAIGSPFSFDHTVTAGIISAKGREIPRLAPQRRQFQRFIQTDAAINHGNSGGPLLNINGEVIGINTAIVSSSGGSEGLGFAMPSNTAIEVYNKIIKEGKVVRGSIGIQFKDESDALLRIFGAKSGGVIVGDVTKAGPADRAGIKTEDVIVALNGKPIKNGEELVAIIAGSPVGANLKVTVLRNGKTQDLPVTIGDRAEVFKDLLAESREDVEEPRSAGESMIGGLTVANLTAKQREDWQFNEPGGVVVTKVDPSSFAEDIGLERNDVIVSINRRPVSSVTDVRQIQRELKPGADVAFRVMRRFRDGREMAWRGFFLAGTLPAEQ